MASAAVSRSVALQPHQGRSSRCRGRVASVSCCVGVEIVRCCRWNHGVDGRRSSGRGTAVAAGGLAAASGATAAASAESWAASGAATPSEPAGSPVELQLSSAIRKGNERYLLHFGNHAGTSRRNEIIAGARWCLVATTVRLQQIAGGRLAPLDQRRKPRVHATLLEGSGTPAAIRRSISCSTASCSRRRRKAGSRIFKF